MHQIQEDERSKVVEDRCNDKEANFISPRQLSAP